MIFHDRETRKVKENLLAKGFDEQKLQPLMASVEPLHFANRIDSARCLMINAAQTFRDGGQAIGTGEPRIPQVKIRSYEGIVTKATDWRTLGLSEEELALLGKAEEGDAASYSMSSVGETNVSRTNENLAPERISTD